MNQGHSRFPIAGTALAFLTIVAVGFFALAGWAATASGAGQTAIAIDADPADNTAASLGTIEDCIEVQKGETFGVDFVIQDTSDLLAWETYIAYDKSVLEVADRNVQMFLAVGPERDVFDASESVPDNDGVYRLTAVDIASPPLPHTGSGVLARLTFKAAGEGVSFVSAAPIDRNQDGSPDVGPVFKNIDNNLIGDSDSDTFFDGPIADARVAVDASCSSALTGGLLGGTLTATGVGGATWWVLALVAGVAAASLVVAGTVWARRTQRSQAAGG